MSLGKEHLWPDRKYALAQFLAQLLTLTFLSWAFNRTRGFCIDVVNRTRIEARQILIDRRSVEPQRTNDLKPGFRIGAYALKVDDDQGSVPCKPQ